MEKSGAVAQLEERLVRNEKVGGSIPLGSTILPGLPYQALASSTSRTHRPSFEAVNGF